MRAGGFYRGCVEHSQLNWLTGRALQQSCKIVGAILTLGSGGGFIVLA